MKTAGTQFQVAVNGELFASAVVDLRGQLEITLANRPGQDGAVLAVTATIASTPHESAHTWTDSRVLSAGDSLAVALQEIKSGTAPMISFRSRGIAGHPDVDAPVFCSFCGKEKLKAQKMVAGQNAFICDQCIEMCREIVHET